MHWASGLPHPSTNTLTAPHIVHFGGGGEESRLESFTLKLRRQGLLVLLVLERHGLGPPELLVHLVGHHASVQHPAHHRDEQQTLEEPALPAGANPVPHDGA